MKRLLVALILAAGTAASAASKPPDFGGTWVLDREKSDPPGMGPGGGRGPGAAPTGDITVTITQTDKELKIQREGRDGPVTSIYLLDGTESKNIGPRGGETRSKSRWDGDRLLTEGQQTIMVPDRSMTVDFKETRRLEDDGKTMVIETLRTTPAGRQTRKTVFTKKPAS